MAKFVRLTQPSEYGDGKPVFVNLDHVQMITPSAKDGAILYFSDDADYTDKIIVTESLEAIAAKGNF